MGFPFGIKEEPLDDQGNTSPFQRRMFTPEIGREVSSQITGISEGEAETQHDQAESARREHTCAAQGMLGGVT